MDHHLWIDGRMQCVAVLVTCTGPDGKQYVVLGRGDPRYSAAASECVKGTLLPVLGWKFAGGFVERVEEPIDDGGIHYDATWHGVPPEIGPNGMKELGEEFSISAVRLDEEPSLRGLLAQRSLRYVGLLNGAPSERHDVHLTHLDLGPLTDEQFQALKRVVHPRDDMIQTIIAPVGAWHRNGETMGLCPADGHCTVKSGFDGFPEIEQWNARFNRLLEHQRGPSVDRLRAWLEAVNWIHDHMHGMGGIDTSTLEHCGRIPMFYTGNERWLPHEVPSTPIAAGGAAERRTVAISPDGAGEGAGRSA